MVSSSELPWTKIHEFLLDVGNAREPKELCVQVIKKIYRLIPYDQARVYFVNDFGKIYDQVLIGVEQTWSDVYLEHYSRIENGRYSIPNRSHMVPDRIERGRYSFPNLEGGVYDWTSYKGDEFMAEYIRPQRLNYSAGFAFHDAAGFIKSVYILDRTGRNEYMRTEIDIMSVVHSHLDNLRIRQRFDAITVLARRIRQAIRAMNSWPSISARSGSITAPVLRFTTPTASSRAFICWTGPAAMSTYGKKSTS